MAIPLTFGSEVQKFIEQICDTGDEQTQECIEKVTAQVTRQIEVVCMLRGAYDSLSTIECQQRLVSTLWSNPEQLTSLKMPRLQASFQTDFTFLTSRAEPSKSLQGLIDQEATPYREYKEKMVAEKKAEEERIAKEKAWEEEWNRMTPLEQIAWKKAEEEREFRDREEARLAREEKRRINQEKEAKKPIITISEHIDCKDRWSGRGKMDIERCLRSADDYIKREAPRHLSPVSCQSIPIVEKGSTRFIHITCSGKAK